MESIDICNRTILEDCGITCLHQIQSYTPSRLSLETGLSLKQSLSLIQRAKSALDSSRTPLHLSKANATVLNHQKVVLTMSRAVDELLGGGVHLHELTEVWGKPGSGKTQLCFQLACSVQIPESIGGVGGECVYIDTENTFMASRVAQMGTSMLSHMKRLSSGCEPTLKQLLSRIHVLKANSWSELVNAIGGLEDIIQKTNSKLVIIDSMAFPFRQTNVEHKHRKLALMAKQMALMANRTGAAFVAVNHETLQGPALGQTWAQYPHTSIRLLKEESGERAMELRRSTGFAQGKAFFDVKEKGLRDVMEQNSQKRMKV